MFIDAPCGRLKGMRDAASGVTAFWGVPYAAPPLGPRRWKPPEPLAPWAGTRDAAKAGKRAIQHAPYGELEPDSPGMSEDCLFLNIWTPDVAARLPVIFWIHGGEFWAGSGSEPRYNGAKLAARGAVVVTINHRLGVFGFLSHPALSRESDWGTSGNYGLLDQIAALEWTRANIACFGGDPQNITVAGESAGSCSVSFLMASPRSKTLFYRALGQSCAYFMPEPHAMKPLPHTLNEERGMEFMQATNVHSLEGLRAMSGEDLLAVWRKNPAKRMQPCVDHHILPDVAQVFAEGGQAKVPLLCGWNGDEYGFLRAGREKFDAAQFANRIVADFGADAEVLLAAYRSNDQLEKAADLASDRAMVFPTWKWAEEHGKHAPVYVYQFNRAAPVSAFGATHASELEYVFGVLDSKPRDYTRDDYDLSRCIGDYWVNFARTGDPNGGAHPLWPAYDPEKIAMVLDAECAAAPLQNRARLQLLDRLYAKKQSGQ